MLPLRAFFAATLAAATLVAATGAQSTWLQLHPRSSPPPRDTHGMAFDTVAGKGVLFGGYDISMPSVQRGDTWEWDGADWTETTPTTSPSARETFGMAQDGQGGILLFGGHAFGEGLKGDTWRYRAGTWTQLSPANSPAKRRSHHMVSTGSSILLFGGQVNSHVLSAETWEWKAGNWTNRTPAVSPPPGGGSMAYDSGRCMVVLLTATTPPQTWEWDGTFWTQRNPATVPDPGFNNAMTYDPIRRRSVLVTGSPSATWEWDGQDWRPVANLYHPSIRSGFSVVYDGVNDAALLFGGRETISLDGTWLYVPNAARASYTTFGSGCPGTSGPARLAAAAGSSPLIGGNFTIELTNLPSGVARVPFGLLGASKTAWIGGSLPFDLGPIGMPGCPLLVSTDFAVQLLNQGGLATWTVAIPEERSLIGGQFFQQGLIFDPGANALGAITTGAGEATIGV